jgi:hypothetical protein
VQRFLLLPEKSEAVSVGVGHPAAAPAERAGTDGARGGRLAVAVDRAVVMDGRIKQDGQGN